VLETYGTACGSSPSTPSHHPQMSSTMCNANGGASLCDNKLGFMRDQFFFLFLLVLFGFFEHTKNGKQCIKCDNQSGKVGDA
jgi:hypothetical protein